MLTHIAPPIIAADDNFKFCCFSKITNKALIRDGGAAGSSPTRRHCVVSFRVRTDLEKAFFWKNHGILIFLPLSWKSHGFFRNHHGNLKNTMTELFLVCGIVVFPKLAQNFDTQSAEIWPLLKLLVWNS